MKKIMVLLLGISSALWSCVKEECSKPVVDPITIPQASRQVTLPNELEDGVFSVGHFRTNSFTVDQPWSIDPQTVPAWCTIEPMSGQKGEITLTFVVKQENYTWANKMADVVIKPLVGSSATVLVTHPGLSNGTIYVPAAGTLEAVLTALEITAPLEVKIVGNLNYADIEKLNSTTSLVSINLKGAHIENNKIPNQAFRLNEILKTFVFPATLTAIGDEAFYGMNNMKGQLILPVGVRSIGERAFAESRFTGDLTLPAGLNTIGESAFENCLGFTTLTLPAGLVTIAQSAFRGSGFTGEIELPQTLTTIGEQAFGNVNFTGNLLIPPTVTSVGVGAFAATRVSTITIYEETSFSDTPFFGSEHVISLHCVMATPPDYNLGILFLNNVNLIVPIGSTQAYKDHQKWSGFKAYYEK